MPNWCTNFLTVYGTPAAVQAFRVLAQGVELGPKGKERETPLSFQSLLPQPNDIGGKWYEWRNAVWGTKWDLRGEDTQVINESNDHIEYMFDTAWSPPVPLFQAIVEQLSTLNLQFHLTYYELGNDFYGELLCSGGTQNNVDDCEYSRNISADHKNDCLPDWMPDTTERFEEDDDEDDEE